MAGGSFADHRRTECVRGHHASSPGAAPVWCFAENDTGNGARVRGALGVISLLLNHRFPGQGLCPGLRPTVVVVGTAGRVRWWYREHFLTGFLAGISLGSKFRAEHAGSGDGSTP